MCDAYRDDVEFSRQLGSICWYSRPAASTPQYSVGYVPPVTVNVGPARVWKGKERCWVGGNVRKLAVHARWGII